MCCICCWMKTLNVEYLFPCRLEVQNVVVSVAVSKAGDSELGICYCLLPCRPETISVNLHDSRVHRDHVPLAKH